MRNSDILDIFFKFILTWFAISHTTYILTLVDNIHIFPKFLTKANHHFRQQIFSYYIFLEPHSGGDIWPGNMDFEGEKHSDWFGFPVPHSKTLHSLGSGIGKFCLQIKMFRDEIPQYYFYFAVSPDSLADLQCGYDRYGGVAGSLLQTEEHFCPSPLPCYPELLFSPQVKYILDWL